MADYELENTVYRLFQNDTSTNGSNSWHGSRRRQEECMFMDIPLNKSEIEIPLFAFSQFLDCIKWCPETEVLAAELYSIGRTPKYKTVGRYMRDILYNKYDWHRLIEMKVKHGENTILYYGTQGLVLDRMFDPMMMCSWVIRKDKTEGDWKYQLVRPLLRISPYCYLHQEDDMLKFIVRKMLNSSLTAYISTPALIAGLFKATPITKEIKIEIATNPFSLHGISKPSIQTTNEQLLLVARNHIEEIIQ